MTKRIVCLTVVALLCLSFATAYAEHTGDSSYIYDFWGSANESLSAFELSTTINSDVIEGVTIQSVDDVYVEGNRIYIADSESNAIYVVDAETYQLIKEIKLIREVPMDEETGAPLVDETTGEIVKKIVVDPSSNKQALLSAPEGVYANENYLYIADTGNNRIFLLYTENSNKFETMGLDPENEADQKTMEAMAYTLAKVINKPDNMVGSTDFTPTKIAVDNASRIFVVPKTGTEGIIELNSDGSFSRYFGVNSPTVSLIDYFWKSIASDEQKEQMSKVYAPAFTNVQTDSDGFVYAVTTDTASEEMAFRFNAKGENVLRKFGYSEQLGDLPHSSSSDDTATKSTFTDVAVSDYGVYALLDTARNRVFLYNFDGNLLTVFGGKGDTEGKFKTPSSICWLGNSLVVGDSDLAAAFIFTPTDFGELVLEAEEKYYNGDFSGAAELNQKVVEMNANYDHAYVSIGKNYLMQDEYETAMEYFRLGNDKTYYSQAFAGYRNLVIQKYFAIIAIIFIAFVAWVLWTEVKYNKQQKKLEEI